MYTNIKQQVNTIAPIQNAEKGVVKKRKRGRPPRKHMGRYTIKMDKNLYEKVADLASELGTSNSFLISEGTRMFLRSRNI